MGNYNPHAPRIIGQEWIPIRDEDIAYSPSVDALELGHSFDLTTTRQVRDARFYINQMQAPYELNQVAMVNIYPLGSEDRSGPISEVLIPAAAIAPTGTGITNANVTALYQPGGDSTVAFAYNNGGGIQQCRIWFNVSAYPVLANKRILNVSLVYSGSVTDKSPEAIGGFFPNIPFVNPAPATLFTIIRQRDDVGQYQEFTGPEYAGNTGTLAALSVTPPGIVASPGVNQTIGVLNLGDINNFWDPSRPPFTNSNTERMPWRYADLLRLDPSFGPGRQHIWLGVQIPATPYAVSNPLSGIPLFELDYMALRVIYCEETRVAYGAKQNFPYQYGMNSIIMRDQLFNPDPILTPGRYLPTLSWVNPGEIDYVQANAGAFPEINGTRELYTIPSHIGTQVNIPFPLHEQLGKTITSEVTHVLPQLTLHASGGPLTEPQVYGRQAIAQVWGTQSATQEIEDGRAGGSANWPWVRYYARRFGDTTVSLTLTAVGQTATISPSEFDALDEVIDGWKEITLRFSTPPVMGTGTQPTITWTAAGEQAGNRWEILGAVAPAISGVPGSLLTPVPSPNQLGISTYGQPVSGSIINLGWMPQGIASPWVTGFSDDNASDAFVIFAQDMPTVTGFTVFTASQPISGIGQGCGSIPCCIPSAILYNQISWTATSSSIPTSGFGYYELQRQDTVTTDWQTIMKSTSPTGASFKDFEARIGLQSSYRIRAVDYYLFPGPWSNTISITSPAPGVSGGCISTGHVLVFTSNERQSGSINLAYSEAWLNGQVAEDFTFPEAGFVQLQAMYNRDFFTAFRPLERGGERFSRTILVQAAAIAPETLADFTSLRNMAWDTVSYICVRDEDGNRWFATVLVPGGRVLNDRRLYLGNIDIIEVTDTPSPANPYA